MKGKKPLLLFLALMSPVLIFIFLRMFGRNEFTVAPLHQQGDIQVPPDCHGDYRTPYRVADSVMSQIGLNPGDSLYVLYFDRSLAVAMTRVSVEFEGDPLQVALFEEPAAPGIQKCALLMEAGASTVLLDNRRRIRGYYNSNDRDEVDRLIVEIKIILKKY